MSAGGRKLVSKRLDKKVAELKTDIERQTTGRR